MRTAGMGSNTGFGAAASDAGVAFAMRVWRMPATRPRWRRFVGPDLTSAR